MADQLPTMGDRRTTITFTPTLKPASVMQRPSTGGTTSSEEEEDEHPLPTKESTASKWKEKCKKFFGLGKKQKNEELARGRTSERSLESGESSRIKPYNEAAAASLPDIIGARKWRKPSPFPRERRPEPSRSKTAPQIHVSPPPGAISTYPRQHYDSTGEDWFLRTAGR